MFVLYDDGSKRQLRCRKDRQSRRSAGPIAWCQKSYNKGFVRSIIAVAYVVAACDAYTIGHDPLDRPRAAVLLDEFRLARDATNA
jgi:hypothetical protein